MWYLLFLLVLAGVESLPINGTKPVKNCKHQFMCPANFLRANNQYCYFLSETAATWQDAHFDCKERNSSIVTLRNGNQDRTLRKLLNRRYLVKQERWIGGVYDWKQMQWKWAASGKPIRYKGFPSQQETIDKDQLKWNCILLDPAINYAWRAEICTEMKHYICQRKQTKVSKNRKKSLETVPDGKPNQTAYENGNAIDNGNWLKNTAFAIKNETTIETMKRQRNRNRKRRGHRKACDNNGKRYNIPETKSGIMRRSHKKFKLGEKDGMKNFQSTIYYSPAKEKNLPRVLTEEISFNMASKSH